jgi:peptidoglycan/LPS O-acetylase OafA/YrhL
MNPGRYENNFDLLRFLSAAVVIVSHAYVLSRGYGNVGADDLFLLVGYAALSTLFVISGYLITASWESTASPFAFFWKRFLRVVPGLGVVILFTLFILGPLMTSLPLSTYVSNLFSWQGLFSFPFFEDGSAIGLFQQNPVTFVNASLWTIPVEVGMYVVVALLGIAGILRSRGTVLSLIVLNVFLWMAWYDDQSLSKVRFTLYFLIGAYFYLSRDRITYEPRIAASLIAVLALASLTPYGAFANVVCLPYLVLYAAHLPVPALNGFGRPGDFSYGLYIYAYPIQQSLVSLTGDTLSLPVFCALSLLLTFPLAFLSWNLVERRALALKSRRPRDLFRAYLTEGNGLPGPADR